ncbi:MAG: ankyrin repeat domain-containing protein [Spirulinaceae cyanobacterium]
MFNPFEFTSDSLSPEDCLKIRELILAKKLNPNSISDEVSLLGLISESGDIETVRFMLQQGADVNLPTDNPDVTTPLMDAVRGGSLSIVELLVKEGADINEIRDGGNSALLIAIDAGHQDIFDYLAPLTNQDIKDEILDEIDIEEVSLNLDKILA